MRRAPRRSRSCARPGDRRPAHRYGVRHRRRHAPARRHRAACSRPSSARPTRRSRSSSPTRSRRASSGRLSAAASVLAERFWPGGMTLVLPVRAGVVLPGRAGGRHDDRRPGPGPSVPRGRSPLPSARFRRPPPTGPARPTHVTRRRSPSTSATRSPSCSTADPSAAGPPRRSSTARRIGPGSSATARSRPGCSRDAGAAGLRARPSLARSTGRSPDPSGAGRRAVGPCPTRPASRSEEVRRVPGSRAVRRWATIAEVDPELWTAMEAERHRQADKIELIACENYVHAAVLEAQGSWLTNKYAEGLPGKRYYGGCEFVDIVEDLARERALALFPGAEHVNVQPHSGAQANMAAYFAVLQPGDRDPGHEPRPRRPPDPRLAAQLLGQAVRGPRLRRRARTTERIDYDALERRRQEVRPKLVVAGASAYPRIIDFERHGGHRPRRRCAAVRRHGPHRRASSRRVSIPSPFPHADLVTTTTHKTLRGPRGGMIFSRGCRRRRPAVPEVKRPRAHRQDGLPGHPGRPADARHRGQGRRLQAGR